MFDLGTVDTNVNVTFDNNSLVRLGVMCTCVIVVFFIVKKILS